MSVEEGESGEAVGEAVVSEDSAVTEALRQTWRSGCVQHGPSGGPDRQSGRWSTRRP
jgi:hypothetical protein